MRKAGLGLACAAALCVLGGLMAPLHPALDSLGIAMPYAALALLAAALLLRLRAALRLAAAAVGLAGLLPIAATAHAPAEPGKPALRLLQHNLFFKNDAADLDERILAHDVVTLQEVRAAAPMLAELPAGWTMRACGDTNVGATAVATRLVPLAQGCLNDGHAWMRVATDAGPVTVVSLHLHWPWPAAGDRQARQIARLAPLIRALPRPVIVAGDFNQMPWSAAVDRIAEAADTEVAPGLRVTLALLDGLARLPIDHVLIPEGWGARVEPAGRHGSDHVALAAELLGPAT